MKYPMPSSQPSTIMLLPNNNEIDVDLLTKKIEVIKSRGASISHRIDDMCLKVVPQIQVRSVVSDSLTLSLRRLLFKGEGARRRIGRIPFLGSAIIWINSIFRLNAIRHKIALDFDVLTRANDQLRHQLSESRSRMAEMTQQLQLITLQQREHFQKMSEQCSHLSSRITQLESLSIVERISHLDNRIQQMQVGNVERDNRLANQVRELHQLSVSAHPNSMSQPLGVGNHNVNATRDIDVPGMNGFYLEFEDNFRGSETDISSRLSVYLPYLTKFSGVDTAKVVDIGCGRGEWLRLLELNNINAIGVDMNAAMVAACSEKHLNAVCMDAIDYLRQQPQGSLAAVTGFHIIEHLPFKLLLTLFDVSLKALRPDGLVIFETPNPENLLVGACSFYSDPTHLNPIVPAVAEFMARQRGFARAEILRLHPYPEEFKLTEDSELAKRMNAALYGPQDFAVIAWKNNAN
ncbi:class I SAM-dependent methyltransferase [Undibacterium danionis]|uniref:Class I SAM-dependent methyltransferase n=1 Tax=Undibacterium danionis TaxID=1812100 RepID=A0ABV6IH75_9BURK